MLRKKGRASAKSSTNLKESGVLQKILDLKKQFSEIINWGLINFWEYFIALKFSIPLKKTPTCYPVLK